MTTKIYTLHRLTLGRKTNTTTTQLLCSYTSQEKAEKALYEHLKEVMSANRFRLKYSTAEIIYEDEFSLIQVSIRATNLVN